VDLPVASGAVSGQLLQAADHEANLLGHPYIGLEHLDLGRLNLAGLTTERDALRQRMRVGVTRRWWRPLGPNSALRRQAATKRRSLGDPQSATSAAMMRQAPGNRSSTDIELGSDASGHRSMTGRIGAQSSFGESPRFRRCQSTRKTRI
jgi:hypothetical protein